MSRVSQGCNNKSMLSLHSEAEESHRGLETQISALRSVSPRGPSLSQPLHGLAPASGGCGQSQSSTGLSWRLSIPNRKGAKWPGSSIQQDRVLVPYRCAASSPESEFPYTSLHQPCPPPSVQADGSQGATSAPGQACWPGGRSVQHRTASSPHSPLTSSSQSRGEDPGAQNKPLEADHSSGTHLRGAASESPFL